ncbi:MAG TPA: hypothetical protein VMM35_01245, partial [Longimicrobiales bacterium]|nr:hypothetical protein [Longimicrobiales bacterium]
MSGSRIHLIAAALVALFAVPAAAQRTLDSYTPVTEARLADPEPESWIFYRGTRDGWGYSPLDQI